MAEYDDDLKTTTEVVLDVHEQMNPISNYTSQNTGAMHVGDVLSDRVNTT